MIACDEATSWADIAGFGIGLVFIFALFRLMFRVVK